MASEHIVPAAQTAMLTTSSCAWGVPQGGRLMELCSLLHCCLDFLRASLCHTKSEGRARSAGCCQQLQRPRQGGHAQAGCRRGRGQQCSRQCAEQRPLQGAQRCQGQRQPDHGRLARHAQRRAVLQCTKAPRPGRQSQCLKQQSVLEIQTLWALCLRKTGLQQDSAAQPPWQQLLGGP